MKESDDRNMYYGMGFDELRSYCRKCIDSLEHWARRLIHEQLTEKYGSNYLCAVNANNEPIVKKSIRENVENLLLNHPLRFKRPVDALFLDDIVYFLCNPNFYAELFKSALDFNYPQGRETVREFLSRIVPIRNALSHSNPISIRQAEQVICYSNDFIEGLKKYYEQRGMDRMWNVPRFIKATDSLGNVFYPNEDMLATLSCHVFDLSNTNNSFKVGDTYTIELEIDSTFEESLYLIKWSEKPHDIYRSDLFNSKIYSKTFDESNVMHTFTISADIISTKTWHRFGNYDDSLVISVTVLPHDA